MTGWGGVGRGSLGQSPLLQFTEWEEALCETGPWDLNFHPIQWLLSIQEFTVARGKGKERK